MYGKGKFEPRVIFFYQNIKREGGRERRKGTILHLIDTHDFLQIALSELPGINNKGN